MKAPNKVTAVQPPIVVNKASGYGTGQLPDKEGQMYYITEDELYLIPTAEVPITNLYRDVILTGTGLPCATLVIRRAFVARRVVGAPMCGDSIASISLIKVEIVEIRKPEESYATLDAMCSYVQSLLEKLGCLIEIIALRGDMGFNSAQTF